MKAFIKYAASGMPKMAIAQIQRESEDGTAAEDFC